jgi:hypothetical protein
MINIPNKKLFRAYSCRFALIICFSLRSSLFSASSALKKRCKRSSRTYAILIAGLLVSSGLAGAQDWRQGLPRPVLPAERGWLDLYDAAWQIADQQSIECSLGKTFSDGNSENGTDYWHLIWTALYGKYLQDSHPQIKHAMTGIDQFYKEQHEDGYIPYKWGYEGSDRVMGPVFTLAEWHYFQHVADTARLETVVPVLDRFYDAVKSRHAGKYGLYRTSWNFNGMGNRPVLADHIVDLTAQQALNARYLRKMALVLGDSTMAQKYEQEHAQLTRALNEHLWLDSDQFYVDLHGDYLYNHWMISGFWPLLARVSEKQHLNGLLAALNDPYNFNTPHRVPTMGGQNTDGFSIYGERWHGSVMPAMNAMVIWGLEVYGQDSLAYQIAEKHLLSMYMAWIQSGTIYENYSPVNIGEPGSHSQWNFVGWSGLTPITLFIENVLGIRVKAPEKTIEWSLNRTDEHGIKNLQWGPDFQNRIDMIISKAPNRKITVKTNCELVLQLDHPKQQFELQPGEHELKLWADD